MPFISNQEREHRTKKLYKGNSFRKVLIIISLIITGVYIAYVALCAALTMGYTPDSDWLNSFTKFFIILDPQTLSEQGGGVNAALILLVVTCCVGGLLLVSLILTLTFKSAKKISQETIKLASAPVAGKKNSSNSAQNYRDRVKAGSPTKKVK